MAGVNKVILIGNLGKDPEVRSLESGAKMAKFPLATTESYKGKDGNRVEHTEWHNIVLWRGLADVAERYLKKGNSVYIEGSIRTRKWDDQDGKTNYMTEIQCDNMTMLGSRRDQGADAPPVAANQVNEPPAKTNAGDKAEDDLPF